MEINDIYSFKGGKEFLEKNHMGELEDVINAIKSLDINKILTKKSKEKNKPSIIFSPIDMNKELSNFLHDRGWTESNVNSKKGLKEPKLYLNTREFRAMDGLKNKVGLEVQFGKYAFMGYDIFSKMPIFKNKGLIDCGIEVVLSNSMIPHMSTGVSSFNQIIMDIKARGESDLDIPVLIIGFECSSDGWKLVEKIRSNGIIKETGLQGTIPGPK